MATHTPGPWKLIDLPNADGIGIVPAKLPKGVARRDAEDIASVSKSNEQHDSRANARLIAAAPDLLAACEMVMRCARGQIERPATERQPWPEAQRLLEAAIAKASGQ